MNLALLYLLAIISVVLAVLPPTIDPRLGGITEMQIKIVAELKDTKLINGKIWSRGVFTITPEFVATSDKTRLVILKKSISQVIENIKNAVKSDIEIAVKANMEEKANVNIEAAVKAKIEKTAKEDLSKACRVDPETRNRQLRETAAKTERYKMNLAVLDHIKLVRFSLVVVSYTDGGTIISMPGKTFPTMKINLTVDFCYSYFKLQEGKQLKDGEVLQFHNKQYQGVLYPARVTNVLKDREKQVEVEEPPLDFGKVTERNKDGNSEIVDIFGLTGPYYGCDVALVA